MPFKLYGSPLSPYLRAAQIVFAEHGFEYELVTVGPAEFAARKADGRVGLSPAIGDSAGSRGLCRRRAPRTAHS